MYSISELIVTNSISYREDISTKIYKNLTKQIQKI